jgi:hypothetical protein
LTPSAARCRRPYAAIRAPANGARCDFWGGALFWFPALPARAAESLPAGLMLAHGAARTATLACRTRRLHSILIPQRGSAECSS